MYKYKPCEIKFPKKGWEKKYITSWQLDFGNNEDENEEEITREKNEKKVFKKWKIVQNIYARRLSFNYLINTGRGG